MGRQLSPSRYPKPYLLKLPVQVRSVRLVILLICAIAYSMLSGILYVLAGVNLNFSFSIFFFFLDPDQKFL